LTRHAALFGNNDTHLGQAKAARPGEGGDWLPGGQIPSSSETKHVQGSHWLAAKAGGFGAHRPITLSQNNLNKSRTAPNPPPQTLGAPAVGAASTSRRRNKRKTSTRWEGVAVAGRKGGAGQSGRHTRRAEWEPNGTRGPGCQDVAGVWKCRRKSTTTHTQKHTHTQNYVNRECVCVCVCV